MSAYDVNAEELLELALRRYGLETDSLNLLRTEKIICAQCRLLATP